MDATKSEKQRKLLETELEAVGIRLNTKAPDGESVRFATLWSEDQSAFDIGKTQISTSDTSSFDPVSSRFQAKNGRRSHHQQHRQADQNRRTYHPIHPRLL